MCLKDMRATMVSKHYKTKRANREDFIREHLGGDGYMVDGFIVSRNHPMGDEIHNVTDNGLIKIYNIDSGKLCTKLIARPNQIMRLYESTGREKPPEYEDILELAREHKRLGYNEI